MRKRLPLDAVAAVFAVFCMFASVVLLFFVAEKGPVIVLAAIMPCALLAIILLQPRAGATGYSAGWRARSAASKAGKYATAQVEKIATSDADGGELSVRLDLIVASDAGLYRAKTLHSIDYTATPRYQPGAVVAVRVHPERPEVVVVVADDELQRVPPELADRVGQSTPLELPEPAAQADDSASDGAPSGRGPLVPKPLAIGIVIAAGAAGVALALAVAVISNS